MFCVQDLLALINMQHMLAELESLVPLADPSEVPCLSVVHHGQRNPSATSSEAPPHHPVKKPRHAPPTTPTSPGSSLSWIWPGSGAVSLMRYGYSSAVLRCQDGYRARGGDGILYQSESGAASTSVSVDLHMQWAGKESSPAQRERGASAPPDKAQVPECCQVSCHILAQSPDEQVRIDRSLERHSAPKTRLVLPREVVSSYGLSADSCLGGDLGLLLDTLAITAWPMAQLARCCTARGRVHPPLSSQAEGAGNNAEEAETVIAALVPTHPPYQHRLVCPIGGTALTGAQRLHLAIDIQCSAGGRSWLWIRVITLKGQDLSGSVKKVDGAAAMGVKLVEALRGEFSSANPVEVAVRSNGVVTMGMSAAAGQEDKHQIWLLSDNRHLERVVLKVVGMAKTWS